MPDQTVIKYDPYGHPETGLQTWEPIPREIIASGEPVQRGHQYFAVENDKVTSGVWDCSPMQRVPATIERSELMHILEGSGSITNADGVIFNFKAGDTFLVSVGMGYQWKNDEYVKKVFCSYTP